MSGRIIPTIGGKGFLGIGPPPTFWSLIVGPETVMVLVGVSCSLLICCCEYIFPVESFILDHLKSIRLGLIRLDLKNQKA